MSAVMELAEELEREADESSTGWPTVGAPADVRALREAARRIREAAAKDAAELERLRAVTTELLRQVDAIANELREDIPDGDQWRALVAAAAGARAALEAAQ